MLRIVTLDLKTFSSSLSFVQVDSWGNSEALLFQLSPPPEEPKGTTLPAEAPDVRCYGEQGGGMRHQISPVPKAGTDRVSSSGAKPKPCAVGRISVYTSVVPGFLKPEQTRGKLETRRGKKILNYPSCHGCVCTCLSLYTELGDTVRQAFNGAEEQWKPTVLM